MATGANRQPKSAVGQRPCSLQYRPQGLLELRPGCGGRDLPYQADIPINSPELFSMTSRHANHGVYQLTAQDRRHLYRHQVLRLAQVGSDEDLKMATSLH
jgi:hypothetical protein